VAIARGGDRLHRRGDADVCGASGIYLADNDLEPFLKSLSVLSQIHDFQVDTDEEETILDILSICTICTIAR